MGRSDFLDTRKKGEEATKQPDGKRWRLTNKDQPIDYQDDS